MIPSEQEIDMAAHPYKVENIQRDAKGQVRKADLTENGIVIAVVQKGVGPYPYYTRFFSSQARARFDSFADSLSTAEAIEALI